MIKVALKRQESGQGDSVALSEVVHDDDFDFESLMSNIEKIELEEE